MRTGRDRGQVTSLVLSLHRLCLRPAHSGQSSYSFLSTLRMAGNAGRISLDVLKLVLEELQLGDNGLHELFCILTVCKSWKVRLPPINRQLMTH
jgi:hypothetical protein